MAANILAELTPEKLSDIARTTEAGLKRFTADEQYFSSHYNELRAAHPDQWVAILEEKVAAHGTNLELVIKQMQADGINPGKAYVQRTYLKETPPHFILQKVACSCF